MKKFIKDGEVVEVAATHTRHINRLLQLGWVEVED